MKSINGNMLCARGKLNLTNSIYLQLHLLPCILKCHNDMQNKFSLFKQFNWWKHGLQFKDTTFVTIFYNNFLQNCYDAKVSFVSAFVNWNIIQ